MLLQDPDTDSNILTIINSLPPWLSHMYQNIIYRIFRTKSRLRNEQQVKGINVTQKLIVENLFKELELRHNRQNRNRTNICRCRTLWTLLNRCNNSSLPQYRKSGWMNTHVKQLNYTSCHTRWTSLKNCTGIPSSPLAFFESMSSIWVVTSLSVASWSSKGGTHLKSQKDSGSKDDSGTGKVDIDFQQ